MDSNKVLCYPGVGQLHQQGPRSGGAPASRTLAVNRQTGARACGRPTHNMQKTGGEVAKMVLSWFNMSQSCGAT